MKADSNTPSSSFDRRYNHDNKLNSTDKSAEANQYPPLDGKYLHHAAFIDAQGNEIEITPQMIDLACDLLISPRQLSASAP